ncbi:MAG: CTP-dependent riboflavin kinase [Candidatus Tectomicrobia bacterium]|uniref:Riboflavin kinase n=1 Tax=Tectimicrobiota bacterium TaxID=2528274 RepID=A0A932CQ53_UNCTE|nr:CTP-dependent riboflavin kinase [Candidatus Tectomicrobia bacterium]
MMKDREAQKEVHLKGVVVSGLGEGRFFTELPWAREQFIGKVGIDPYPGTLNLRLDSAEGLKQWEALRGHPGITIVPPEAGFCNGKCFRILIQGRVPGAIVFPEVAGYPVDKLEVIASCNLKEALGIRDGDEILLEVVPFFWKR